MYNITPTISCKQKFCAEFLEVWEYSIAETFCQEKDFNFYLDQVPEADSPILRSTDHASIVMRETTVQLVLWVRVTFIAMDIIKIHDKQFTCSSSLTCGCMHTFDACMAVYLLMILYRQDILQVLGQLCIPWSRKPTWLVNTGRLIKTNYNVM